MRTAIPHIELGTYKCELITNNLFTNVVYICFSVSLESSVMGHDEMLQVLKEKTRLEGQLESLSSEANQVKITYRFLCSYFLFLLHKSPIHTSSCRGVDTITKNHQIIKSKPSTHYSLSNEGIISKDLSLIQACLI